MAQKITLNIDTEQMELNEFVKITLIRILWGLIWHLEGIPEKFRNIHVNLESFPSLSLDIRRNLNSIEANLVIADKDLILKDFVQSMLGESLFGFLRSLKRTPLEFTEISINIE